jgi:hypothetical protein
MTYQVRQLSTLLHQVAGGKTGYSLFEATNPQKLTQCGT